MKTKLTFKKRLVSGLLALTMVLGFLPANLFPVAKAVDLPPNGGLGTTVGDISLSIATDGTCTVTLNSTTAGNNSVTFAIIPAFTSKSTAVQDAFGTRLNTKNTAAGNLLENIGAYYDADLPTATHPQETETLKLGTNTFTVNLPSNPLGTLNKFVASHSSLNGIAPKDGVYTYILLFVTGSSNLQWTYATISSEGEANLVSSNDIVIHHTAGTIVGGYSPTTTITNNGSGNAYISKVEYVGLDNSVTARLNGVAEGNTVTKGSTGSTYGVGNSLYGGTPTQSGYVTITYTTATSSGTASSTAPVKTLTINVTIIDDRFNITVPQELVFAGSYDGSTITWTSKPDLVLTPHHDQGSMWFSEDGAWMRWDDIRIGVPTACSVSDENQYGWDISSLTGKLTNRTSASSYTLGEPSSLSPGSIVSVTDYVAYLTIPYSYQCWYNENTDDYDNSENSPPENDESWIWDEEDTYTGSVMVKLVARITPKETSATYTVTYYMNDETNTVYHTESNVDSGSKATEPADPTKDGYSFGGWYQEKECTNPWDFNTPVTNDVTLYAKWVSSTAKVTYNLNKPAAATSSFTWNAPTGFTQSGNTYTNNSVPQGDYTLADDPSLKGYTFQGWYVGNSKVSDKITLGSNGVILTAQWKANGIYFTDGAGNVLEAGESLWSGKWGSTTITRTAGTWDGVPMAEGHDNPSDDFEIYLRYSGDTSGTDTRKDIMTGADGTGTNTNATAAVANGRVGVTVDSNGLAGKGKVTVYIKSKLNGETATGTVEIQTPPRPQSASATAAGGDGWIPGASVTLNSVTLTDGDEINASAMGDTNKRITEYEWYLGTTSAASSPILDESAFFGTSLGAKNTATVTIPSTAGKGATIWVKVTGNGQTTGVEKGPVYLYVGTVTAPTREVKVAVVVRNSGNTAVTTPPNTLKVAPAKQDVEQNGTFTITTSNGATNSYEFVGWTTDPNGTGAGGTITGTNWTLTSSGVVGAATGNTATFTMGGTLPTSKDPITIYAVYRELPTYTVTVKWISGIKSVNAVNGNTTVTISTSGGSIEGKNVDTITLTATAEDNYVLSDATGYQYTITKTSDGSPAKVGQDYTSVAGDNKGSLTITPLNNITVTFSAKALANLSITGTQAYGDRVEGYTSLSGNPIFTATLKNDGAAAASIDTSKSGLYLDDNGSIGDKYTGSGTGEYFTVSTVPGTVAAGIGTGSTQAQTVTVTPATGLDPGTYTVWLQITENTVADIVKTGTALVYQQKITFVVKEKTTFDGTVKVQIDGGSTNVPAAYKVRLGSTGNGTTLTSGSATFTNLEKSQSYLVYVSQDGSNWLSTGQRLTAATTPVTVNFYTLTIAGGTGAKAVSYTSSKPTTSDSTLTKVVLEGTPVPVYASADTGYDPSTLSWALTDTTSTVANSVVTVKSTVTATASYTAGNGVKYMMNAGDTTTVYYTDNSYYGASANVTLPTKPTRAGYTFAGWATDSNGTVISGSDTAATLSTASMGTASNGYYTLYAQWAKAEATWVRPAGGVYGSKYSSSAAITNGAAVGAVSYALSKADGQTGLPDGLTFNTATGAITGTPRETGTFTFTVTATASGDSSTTWSETFDIDIARATPTITAISFAGVEDGASASAVTVYATVTAPYWDPTLNSNKGDWVSGGKSFTYSASATPDPNPGTLTVTAPATLNFSGATTLNGQVTFTAGTAKTTYQGTHQANQTFADIYDNKVESCVFSLAGKTYGITVDPTSVSASINVGGTLPTTTAWSFDVKNEGNQDAYVTYKLDGADKDNFVLTTSYQEPAGSSVCDKITHGRTETGAFTVGMDSSKVSNKTAGVYTVNVIVENHAGSADGDVMSTVTVPIRFEVKATDYTGSVRIDLNKADGTETTAQALPSNGSVVFKDVLDSTTKAATRNSTSGLYEATLGAGKVYAVVVNDYTIPGMYVSGTDKDKIVDLYEVALMNDSETDTGEVTLAAEPTYLAAGQTGKITAPGIAQSGAYKFEKWVKNTETTAHTTYREFHYQMPTSGAAAVTFHAHYEKVDADKAYITYNANAGSDPVVVPGPTEVAVGSTGTVAASKPIRPGYNFVGWSTDANATKENFDTTNNNGSGKRFDAAPGDTTPTLTKAGLTLYAVWSKQEPTWPNAILTNTTYGAHYSASVAITGGLNTGVTYALASGSALPGGLTFNSDGTITGRPYEVVENHTFKVLATSVDNKDITWEQEFTITVGKAKPTLVNTSGTDAVTGDKFSDGTYSADVAAPMLVTKKDVGGATADVWNDETADTTDDLVASGVGLTTTAAGGGVLTLDAKDTVFVNGKNTVALTWTPGASTKLDANGRTFEEIYEKAKGTATVYTSGETYTLSVTPTNHSWTVKAGYSAADHADGKDGTVDSNTAYGKAFTLTNAGNQASGALTYTFGKTGNAAIFELEANYPTASLDPEGTCTFYVKPKVTTPGLIPGTYTDTLTIASDKGGKAVVYTLTLVVEEAATFSVEVDTYLNPFNASGDGVRALGNGGTVTLLGSDNKTVSGTAGTGSDVGKWTFSNLDAQSTYTVQIEGVSVPGVAVNKNTQSPVTVDLYQLAVGHDENVSSDPTKSPSRDYFQKGEAVTVTAAAANGYAFKDWTLTLEATTTDTVTSNYKTTNVITYIMTAQAAKLTANYDKVYVVKVVDNPTGIGYYSTTADEVTTFETYLDILHGGSVVDNKYHVVAGDAFNLNSPKEGPLGSGEYSASHTGYTFRGWATSSGATDGGYYFVADGSIADSNGVITLYPVWTKDSDLSMSGAVITGTYKHAIANAAGGTASGGTGTYSYAMSPATQLGLSLDSGAATVSGTPNDVGNATAKVTVTDSNDDTATADYSFVIDKANMKLKDSTALPTDISVTLETAVDSIKEAIKGKLPSALDGDGTGETDINGSWTVGNLPVMSTPGTYLVPVTYTAANKEGATDHHAKDGEHYNDFTSYVKVEVTAKLITALDVTLAKGDSAATITKDSVKSGSDTIADTSATVVSTNWAPAITGTVIEGQDYTAIVNLKPAAGWQFDVTAAETNWTGTSDGAAVDVLSVTSNQLILQFYYGAEVKIQSVGASTSDPVDKMVSTTVAPDDSTYKVKSTVWKTEDGTTTVSEDNPFAAGGKYEITVTLTPASSKYKFDTEVLKVGGEGATITSPKVGKKTATIVSVSEDEIVISYKPFEVEEKTVVGISASGKLDVTAYYAKTGTHVDNTAEGHKSGVGFAWTTTSTTSPITVNVKYGDNTTSTAVTGWTLVYGDTPDSVKPMPKDSYEFTDVVNDDHTAKDVSTYDGKNVYVQYTVSGTAYVAPTPVGTLTVRELEAMSITPSRRWTNTELTFTDGDAFSAPDDITADVEFNSDSTPLSNSMTTDYDSSNTVPDYFYAIKNADGTYTEIPASSSLTKSDHNGKELYICYTDVNSNTVRAYVGNLTIQDSTADSEAEVTIWKDGKPTTNGASVMPGETLTAVVEGITGAPSYQWYKDGTPIDGATNVTYVPVDGDVDSEITVKVKEEGTTGNEVESNTVTVVARPAVINNVSHVDVHFAEIPVYEHSIPGTPTGVTDERETLPGEENASTFTATWYTGFKDLTDLGEKATGSFLAGKTYTVVVKVKPNTADHYQYDKDTKYFFHFGNDETVDVTAKVKEAGGVYTMYYTFATAVAAPAPTGLSNVSGLNTTYYAKVDGKHATSNTADNDSIPGGKGKVGFTFDPTGFTGTVIYADGTSKTLNTDTTDDNKADTLEYGTGWRLVYGANAEAAKDNFLDDSNTFHTFVDKETAATGRTEANCDSVKYDGKNVYVRIGNTVLTTSVGTLTVKQLEAESITATGAPTLQYNENDKFSASGVTAVSVKFNQDSMKVTYGNATLAARADAEGKKYYFELTDGTPLEDGVTVLAASHNGKTVYICYTDVNGHEVRSPIGTLAVGSNASTAAIYIENQNHANSATQYGDTLKVHLSGSTDAAYKWQRWDATAKAWVDIENGGNEVTTETYIASKADVGTKVRAILTSDGTKTLPSAGIVSNEISVGKKEITAEWTWTIGSKTWDGTKTAAVKDSSNASAFTYTGPNNSTFTDQLVKDASGTKDNFSLTEVTNAEFASSDAGVRAITLTGGGLPTTPTDWTAYYTLTNVGPTGEITKLQLDWADLTFEVGKIKRYDAGTTVYAKDNTTQSANANPVSGAQNIGAQIDGVTVFDWASSSTLTDDMKSSLSGLTATFVYTSKNALGDGNSSIKVTLAKASANNNYALPSGSHYIDSCTVNAKEITVANADLDSADKNPTTIVGVPVKVLNGDVDGNNNASRLEGSDQAFDFSIVGAFADASKAGSNVTVTIDGTTLTWDDSNYKLTWNGAATTGTVSEANVDHIVSFGNASGVYGDAYSTINDFNVVVAFDAAGASTSTRASLADLTALGLTVKVHTANNAAAATEITGAGLIPWDTGTGTSATLYYFIYKDDTLLTAGGKNGGTITVSPRNVEVDSAVWSLQDSSGTYKSGKYYDGTTTAVAANGLWPAGQSTEKNAAGTVTLTAKSGNILTTDSAVQLVTTSAVLDNANVGTTHTITVTPELTGTNSNRYKVSGTYELRNQIIAKRPVTVSFTEPSVEVGYKDSNGGKTVTLTGTLVNLDKTDLIDGTTTEVVTVTATGTYDQTASVVTAGVGADSTAAAPTGKNNVAVTAPENFTNANYEITWPEKINGSVTPKTITNVAVTYKVPAKSETAGEETGYSSTTELVDDPGTKWFQVANNSTWTGGTELTVGTDTFEAGKFYRVESTVEAQSGYAFTDETQFALNGYPCTGTQLVKNTDGTYTLKYIFQVPADPDDTTIQHVNLTLTAPTVGGTKASTATAVSTYTNLDTYVAPATSLSSAAPSVTWTGTFASDGTFKGGEVYTATISGIAAKTGYKLAEGVDFTVNGSGPAKVGTDASTLPDGITKIEVKAGAADGTYDVIVTFKATEDQTVDVIVRSALPTEGTTIPTVSIPSGVHYTLKSGKWYTDADGTAEVTEFENDKTYYLVATVVPEAGYTLPGTKERYTWTENSQYADIKVKKNDDGSYTAVFSYPLDGGTVQKPEVSIIPANATPPVANKTLDPKGWTSENFTVVGDVTWYKGTEAKGTPVSGTADYSTRYTAEVKVKPKDGVIIAADPAYQFNGVTPNNVCSGPDSDGVYTLTYTFPTTEAKPTSPSQPPSTTTVTVTEELPVVTYWISDNGFTNDLTAEKMARAGAKPTFVPKVSGKEGYTFKGWSEVDPTTLASGAEIKLVDPLTFSISADKTFYAVYDEPRFEHDHYASGYPDGTFKPEQYITRAEVAAIVANSCLDGFDNTANYGNPGNYSDINPNKWYGNDVAYCTMYGVFNGYKDGTFKPDQYITRQELAVVVANMAGMQTNQGLPFTDANSVSKWARNGVYTVYENNWVSGYPDGTFRPQNNITRAETVAIFNGYLHRGVDAKGLSDLTSYMLDASSGGYQGDGMTQYMTWIDVPEKYWAYYHILEATNDHDFHWPDEEKMPPEHWDAAYQDETWRYRQEFAVTYVVGDHGTAASDAVLTISVKEGGMPKTVPAVTADSGWTFKGWAATPNGAVVDPRTVTIKEATTFYGVYEAVKPAFTVRYDAGANGALTAASSETVVQGSQPAHVPGVNAREGWTFKGWAETANGALVTPSAVTISADKTFYAVYATVEPEQPELQTHKAYMSGYDDGTFRPSQAITRADVVTMVVRALGTDYDPNKTYDTSSVTDVAGHPAQNMIGYCIEKGIFSGYKDGTFLPEGTMTRQEFAVVIANLAGGAQENQGLPFTDADSVNKWARNAVYTVYVNGWIGGYKDGSFQPKNNITRAEAAVIFNGFLGRSVDKTSLTDVSAGAASPWSDVKATNWAYQNIMEATTDHSYYTENGVEHWAEP